MSEFNPFAALVQEDTPPPKSKSINTILEEIFAFSLDESRCERNQLIYLEEVSTTFKRKDLDLPLLQHALFDRLFMCNADNDVIKAAKKKFINTKAHESNVITYLYDSYENLHECQDLTDQDRAEIKALIIENVVTAFVQSEIYQDQQLESQLIEVLKDCSLNTLFFKDSCKGILEDEDGGETLLREVLTKIVLGITAQIEKSNIVIFNYNIFTALNLFSTEEYLASIFLDAKPAKFQTGADYSHTPLGALLNTSILPKHPRDIYEHFQDPTDQACNASSEGLLWSSVERLTHHIHTLILSFLTCSPQIKNKTLEWLGLCLKANVDRGKLWNSHQAQELNPANYTTVSDGFMINLSNVMLRLCQPFCSKFKENKILKVDPTYCGVKNEEQAAKGIHLPDLSEETFLLPHDSDTILPTADKYSFVTECFHLAHKTVHLGYQVTVEKIVNLNQEVGRMERAYLDAVAQAHSSDFVDNLKQRMSTQLTKYLSLKAQLSDPFLLGLLFDFITSTSHWLCQVSFNFDEHSYAPLNELPITFPLPAKAPDTLKCIPEFIIENITCYVVFLRRFSPKLFEERGFENMKPILTFVLIYMGSPERIKNPHMRAKLAETLESLLPEHKDDAPALNRFGGFQRVQLFTQHEHRSQIVNSLLEVFVGIEMTGQSVEFEQKFNYRRPMYAIIDYLWTKEEYRSYFKDLAKEAAANMEAVVPPLFLRFINLLINDAVYLLDEALSNMARLKEMETARQNGEWDGLPAQERAQNMGYMHHIGMLARFDNILSRETIKAIEKLTSEIKIVFTHTTMVDRVAAMLNYFLYNLVSPKKTKNFKVKDYKEYSFEPAQTVMTICKVYVNLKESEAFCLGVSQDGRSYSPELFKLAEDVLIKIGGGILVGDILDVAARVALKVQEQKQNDEAVAEAPEHFLDPIMSTLMVDPVILPSSKQTVDRTTIARHLLSDQTDPFNRAPLSMDQVIPNVELATEIKNWLDERTCK